MLHPPDNPVWQALCNHLRHFNRGNDVLKYFPADVSPFVGLKDWDNSDIETLFQQLPSNRVFSVMMVKKVELPPELEIIYTCPLYQMECHVKYTIPDYAPSIQKLGYNDIPQMLKLTDITKPGPFLDHTIDMGNYYGIFENGELAAMAGERLRLPGYTEISAICTSPAHVGKGYASLLTEHVAQHIFDEGHTPILHVKTDNLRAINVYQRVGFDIRSEVFFAIFRKR